MKSRFRRSFNFLTVLLISLYFFSALTPYVSPVVFWPMTFLALVYPILALLTLLLIAAWLIIRKKIAFLLLLVFFIGYKNLLSTFSLKFPSSFNYKKDRAYFRILSWNVRNFDNCMRSAESPMGFRRQMINFLRKADADVLLFQEFAEYDNPAYYSNTQAMDSLGYPYHYISNDFIFNETHDKVLYGLAIFSKKPLSNTGKIMYEHLPVPESFCFADINTGRKYITVFSTHLVSMNLKKRIADYKDPLFNKYDSAFSLENSVYQKLVHYDSLHVKQALQFDEVVSRSSYPVIVSGDLNSTPASYVYHLLKGNKRDVFSEKGFGFGTTYSSLSPTLRIDYILADPEIEVGQAFTPSLYLSDHFPVIADLKID